VSRYKVTDEENSIFKHRRVTRTTGLVDKIKVNLTLMRLRQGRKESLYTPIFRRAGNLGDREIGVTTPVPGKKGKR